MISNERKVGLIPRLFVQGKWGPKEYALLVTDKRSILVLEKESKAGLGGALGRCRGRTYCRSSGEEQVFRLCASRSPIPCNGRQEFDDFPRSLAGDSNEEEVHRPRLLA